MLKNLIEAVPDSAEAELLKTLLKRQNLSNELQRKVQKRRDIRNIW
ncbi:hypothetical protein KHA80_09140 [Anaerobacillus sp. HL2]|nr:hypothetical protein KHA80_09140 [Anaerobacillus sp. HL2]